MDNDLRILEEYLMKIRHDYVPSGETFANRLMRAVCVETTEPPYSPWGFTWECNLETENGP